MSCVLERRTDWELKKCKLQTEALNRPEASEDIPPTGLLKAIDWLPLRLSSWNLVSLFQASHGAYRRGSISHGHGYQAKHLSYVFVLAPKMTSVWAKLSLLAFYYFFNCSWSKTLKKEAKINFHRVQNGRLRSEPMSFSFQLWLIYKRIW